MLDQYNHRFIDVKSDTNSLFYTFALILREKNLSAGIDSKGQYAAETMQSQMGMQWQHYENSDKDKRLRKEKFLRRSTLNELKAYIKGKHHIGTIAQPLLKFYNSMSIDKRI